MSRNHSIPRARDPRSSPGNNRRRLSQNFLTDPGTARTIVRLSGVTPDDLVVEVGPGDGMLTRPLARAAGRVLAYEKDRYYVDRLRRRFADEDRVRCIQGDFRDISSPEEPFAVVANVPYSITTDVVRWCLAAPTLTSATLVTQLEFARKHSGDYGRWTKLAVVNWARFSLELGPRIDRWKFHPVPRVDSAILRLVRRGEPLLAGRAMEHYRDLVELGFSGVGGSLAASLRRAHPARAVRTACAAAGIASDLPVGLVSPEQWITLYEQLSSSG